MIVPVVLAVVAAALANRIRIQRGVVREYASRFGVDGDGIVMGAEAFRFSGTNGCGVLLLHGSGDTPRSLRYLATRLNEAGFTASAPLLPGHGRTPEAFARANADDYVRAAREELASLKATHTRIAIVGLSMGGAVAAQIAAGSSDVRALALLAPYLVPPPTIRRVAATSAWWGLLAPYLKGRGEASVFDPVASGESRAYGTFSPRALDALVETSARGMSALPRLDMPVLVVNSERDNRIPRECAEQALRAFRATPEVHWVSGCGHVITIDYCKEAVAKFVVQFLERNTS